MSKIYISRAEYSTHEVEREVEVSTAITSSSTLKSATGDLTRLSPKVMSASEYTVLESSLGVELTTPSYVRTDEKVVLSDKKALAPLVVSSSSVKTEEATLSLSGAVSIVEKAFVGEKIAEEVVAREGVMAQAPVVQGTQEAVGRELPWGGLREREVRAEKPGYDLPTVLSSVRTWRTTLEEAKLGDLQSAPKSLEELLSAAVSKDSRAIANNTVFRMGVKLLEIKPLVEPNIYSEFIKSLGLDGFESTLVKLSRGEALTDRDIDVLVKLSLLSLRWNDFKRVGTAALDVPSNKLASVAALIHMSGSGGSLYTTNIDDLPRDAVEEYYLKVLEQLANYKIPGYRQDYVASANIRKTLSEVLSRIDVLGNLGISVSSYVRDQLKGLVGEKVASVIGSGVGGLAVTATTNLATVATCGLATPAVIGMYAVSLVRGLANAGLYIDNPIEAEIFVEALKDHLPEIIAGAAGAVAGGYIGSRIGGVVAEKLTIPLLEKMYQLARSKGYVDLANKIANVYSRVLQQKSVTMKLEADNYDYYIYVDRDTGEVRILTSAKGTWRVTDVYKTSVRNIAVKVEDPELVSVFVREALKAGKSPADAIKSLDDFIESIPGYLRNTRDVYTMVKQALSNSKVVEAVLSRKATVVYGSQDAIAIDVGTEVYVIAKTSLGDIYKYPIAMPKEIARTLPAYMVLRDKGINVEELINLFNKFGYENWASKIGEYDVAYVGGKLIISRGQEKLAELVNIGPEIVKNLLSTRDVVQQLLGKGVDPQVIRSIASTLSTSQYVPGVAPAHVAVPIANIYDEISRALGVRGEYAEQTVSISTNKGIVQVKFSKFAYPGLKSAEAQSLAQELKVLTTDSIANTARKLVEGSVAGRGGVVSCHVIAVPRGAEEAVGKALSEAMSRVTSLLSRGYVSVDEVAEIVSDAANQVAKVAGKEVASQTASVIANVMGSMAKGYVMQATIPFTVSSQSITYIPVVVSGLMASTQVDQRAVSETISKMAQKLQSQQIPIQLQQVSPGVRPELLPQQQQIHVTEFNVLDLARDLTLDVVTYTRSVERATVGDVHRLVPRTAALTMLETAQVELTVQEEATYPLVIEQSLPLSELKKLRAVPVQEVKATLETAEEERNLSIPVFVSSTNLLSLEEAFHPASGIVDIIITIPLPEQAPATPPPQTPTPPSPGFIPLLPRLEFTEGPTSQREYVGKLVGEVVVI